jgi:hypothetical protein
VLGILLELGSPACVRLFISYFAPLCKCECKYKKRRGLVTAAPLLETSEDQDVEVEAGQLLENTLESADIP